MGCIQKLWSGSRNPSPRNLPDTMSHTPQRTVSSPTPLADRIARQLRDEIIGGHLPPGTQLVEMDLSARYGASRNTIREVLHQLGREGLATFVRHRGVMVRQVRPGELRDIYIARRALEMRAIEHGDASSATLDAMLQTIENAEAALAARNWNEVGTLSLQVHQQVVSMLGSELLDDFFERICAQLRLIFASHPDESRIQTPDWVRRERLLHGHLLTGDRQAASAELADYLEISEQTLLRVVETYNSP